MIDLDPEIAAAFGESVNISSKCTFNFQSSLRRSSHSVWLDSIQGSWCPHLEGRKQEEKNASGNAWLVRDGAGHGCCQQRKWQQGQRAEWAHPEPRVVAQLLKSGGEPRQRCGWHLATMDRQRWSWDRSERHAKHYWQQGGVAWGAHVIQ